MQHSLKKSKSHALHCGSEFDEPKSNQLIKKRTNATHTLKKKITMNSLFFICQNVQI
jgi:hypothetical protein